MRRMRNFLWRNEMSRRTGIIITVMSVIVLLLGIGVSLIPAARSESLDSVPQFRGTLCLEINKTCLGEDLFPISFNLRIDTAPLEPVLIPPLIRYEQAEEDFRPRLRFEVVHWLSDTLPGIRLDRSGIYLPLFSPDVMVTANSSFSFNWRELAFNFDAASGAFIYALDEQSTLRIGGEYRSLRDEHLLAPDRPEKDIRGGLTLTKHF